MASIAQVTGVDAVALISLIATAARNATTHRHNCEQLSEHVRLIANLLEKLKPTEVMSLPATREPLDGLAAALGRALELVENCRERSYMYMLAMGWSVVYQFRQVQNEIDRYLRLVPLISIVHEYRVRVQNLKESLQAIEEDYREYSLEKEDVEAQTIILKHDRSKKDANVLEKSLSRRYPDLKFHEALLEERTKLQVELQRSQTSGNDNCNHWKVIEHLIDVTQCVVNIPPEKNISLISQSYVSTAKSDLTVGAHVPAEKQNKSKWQTDIFDCCGEPCLCLKACIYPCGIFTWIAHMVSEGRLTREHACNGLIAHSLFCGCFYYTCSVRRKLRQTFNIEGGSCDDFLTHLMCCCCAMVQEWRELEIRGFQGVPQFWLLITSLIFRLRRNKNDPTTIPVYEAARNKWSVTSLFVGVVQSRSI